VVRNSPRSAAASQVEYSHNLADRMREMQEELDIRTQEADKLHVRSPVLGVQNTLRGSARSSVWILTPANCSTASHDA
jgi:hypothetical protein